MKSLVVPYKHKISYNNKHEHSNNTSLVGVRIFYKLFFLFALFLCLIEVQLI